MELTPPKAILFDWDNTLVDTWPSIHEAMSYCFTKMGKEPWTLAQVKAKVAGSMRDEFPKLFGDKWEDAGRYYQEGYLANHLDKLVPLEDALQTVKAIKKANIYQSVVSNKRGDTLRKEAAHMQWNGHFSALVGAGDAANDKPHPDHAYKALEGFEGSYGRDIWFVGDSFVDMEIAENAGFTAIFYGSKKEVDSLSYPVHAQVENHMQLAGLLSRYL